MERNYEDLKIWAQGLDVQEVFDISTNMSMSGVQRSIAYQVAKKLQDKGLPSFKQLKALDRMYEELSSASLAQGDNHQRDLSSYACAEALDIDIKHLCLRMAWPITNGTEPFASARQIMTFVLANIHYSQNGYVVGAI